MRRLSIGHAAVIALVVSSSMVSRPCGAQSNACEGAPEVGVGTFGGDITGAGRDGASSCGQAQLSPDQFVKYVAPADGRLAVSTCGRESDYDTVLSVHSGCPATSTNEIACNDEACGVRSSLAVDVEEGLTYWIRVSGTNGDEGTYSAQLEFGEEGNGVGPDAHASDLASILQVGRFGSEVAFSMRTRVCNLGDELLAWHRNPDPRHPFVVFNLYRLMDDRIEQIGQSWVKHGFAASQHGECAFACTPFEGSQFLGVGCSDVYGEVTNSLQMFYGGRREVNPWTGAFTFEGSHLDIGDEDHDPVEHLLRVEDADLDPSSHRGARYFVEFYVVTHDDIDHENNIMHRELSVDGVPGGKWDVEFLGEAPSEGSVLSQWTGATFAVIPEGELQDDGRCYLKTKVTENADGTWHHEYALFNLDMHRAVQRFSVRVAADTELTNIDFHAPLSHDEGYSNEAWQTTRVGDELAWATETFDANPAANPLRWGTLYNFRFDADVAPIDSSAAIEMYLPIDRSQPFRRGDSNDDRNVDLSDAVNILGHLFLGRAALPCMDSADTNDDGEVDITDAVFLLGSLFLGQGRVPEPDALCGEDPTGDELGCEESRCVE